MRRGFRKTIKSWMLTPFSPSINGDAPPSSAPYSPPPIPSQGAPALAPSAETSVVASSMLSALVVASSILAIPLPIYKPAASHSAESVMPNGFPPHKDSLAVPPTNIPTNNSSSNTRIQPYLLEPSAAALSGPENELRASASLGAQSALSIGQIATELTPIPYIGPLAGCLTSVFQAVERAKVNKEQWKLLQDRCVMVTRIAGAQVLNYGQRNYPGVEEAAGRLEEALNKISNKAQHYNEMNPMVVFLQFKSISDEIRDLFADLDACLNLFSFATDVAQLQWFGELRTVRAKELAELQTVRSLLAETNANIGTISQNSDEIEKMANILQRVLDAKFEVLQDPSTTTSPSYVEAQQLVRTILTVTNLRLPPKLLMGKVCILDYNIPIKTGITCDVYSATFLGGEKVAKKVFRIGMSDREFVRQYAERFLRAAELWWEFRSDYILPFYGIGMESIEGERQFQLYKVSPLMKSFDAVTYLKQYRATAGMKKGILRIITDAALGLQYLHSRIPPFVHSEMRGDNILITDSGGGALGGFGLTKALESMRDHKNPPAALTGKPEHQRWKAPEQFMDDTPALTSSDVWGWAMAALEIISGSIPYHSHTQQLTVMLKVTQGPPTRKDYTKFEDYAYRPDELWELLEWCWKYDPEERPTMDEVVVRLKEIAQMEEYVKQ